MIWLPWRQHYAGCDKAFCLIGLCTPIFEFVLSSSSPVTNSQSKPPIDTIEFKLSSRCIGAKQHIHVKKFGHGTTEINIKYTYRYLGTSCKAR